MSDEWQGWLHEFPSREAVEAHVAASPLPPYASAWATGAPWMRVGGCGDLVVIYLAVIDGEVRERFGGDAAWHAMEMGRAGMWRPITALGEETDERAAGPIIEALDAAAVRLARENAALRDELRAARETIEARDAEYAATLTDAELDEHAVSTVEDVACLAAQLRGAKTTIAELLRADEGERAAREERWSKYLADVERLTAERDAAFNRGVEAMREAAAQHFKRRSEGIEHAAARIACIAPTAAVCATLDEARRVADVADEIRALEVAP